MALSYKGIYASDMYQTYLLRYIVPALLERIQELTGQSFDYEVDYIADEGKAKIVLSYIDDDIIDFQDSMESAIEYLTYSEFSDIKISLMQNQLIAKVIL